MKLEIERLIKINSYAIARNISRQHIYRLKDAGELQTVCIDGVWFIYLQRDELLHLQKTGNLKEFEYKSKIERPKRATAPATDHIKTEKSDSLGIRKL